jgi:hypothetical protein
VRGAFGVFYDRFFDNLALATILNGLNSVSFSSPGVITALERPTREVVDSLAGSTATRFPLPAIWIDTQLSSPRVDTWFAAVEHEISRDAVIQLSYRGARSRNLITTDQVNRFVYGQNDVLNREFEALRYRYNGGTSDYHAFGALLRYRAERGQLQASYTLGHTIDTQSEPLLGEFSDVSYARGQQQAVGLAAFTRLGDSRADRGSSDYDQRHNLVVFSTWDLPSAGGNALLRSVTENWQFAQIAAFRSGFPYTVSGCAPFCAAPSSGIELVRNRASMRPGADVQLAVPIPVRGGKQVLDPNSFVNPPAGEIGSIGRNSLYGPGFWNVDISVGRSVRLPRTPESMRLQFRADVFNVFNHANLGNPVSLRGSTEFGQAFFGRLGMESPLRIVPPANEMPRQIQLQVRLSF